MTKWLVEVDPNTKEPILEDISVDEAIARLSETIETGCKVVGMKITYEQKRAFIFESFEIGLKKGKTTPAEYDEAAVKLGFPTLAEIEAAKRKEAQEKTDSTWKAFWVKKPQPSPEHYECQKCSGTGKFVLYFENGRPKSNTGYDCYSCGGVGWKIRKNRK